MSDSVYDRIKERLENAECFLKSDITDDVYKFDLFVDHYGNNDNLYINLRQDGIPYGDVTVNIIHLPIHLFAVDVNNFPAAEGMLIKNGIAHNTGLTVSSGYCEYPIYELERWVYE